MKRRNSLNETIEIKMVPQLKIRQILIAFLFISFIIPILPAHIHSHTNKERVEDGVFSLKTPDRGKSEAEFDHEVMLGSAKEAEEFDHLPPEEAKRRLGLLLKKIDTNSNDHVDSDELYAWIIKSFRLLSEEESAESFEEADIDGNGYVTWSEQMTDSLDGVNGFNEIGGNGDNMILESDRRLFEAADKNNDERLDKDEYKRYTHPEEFSDMLPTIIENTLEEKDKNENGYIDFEEFIGDNDKYRDEEFLETEKHLFYKVHDKDGDGRLNYEEILKWIVPDSSQIAIEETQHLLAAADENHDSMLSFDEVLNNHEIFVGSEMTDFGEHLENIHKFVDEL